MPGDHNYTTNENGEVVEAFVSEFDFEQLDTIEDQIREALSKGESVTALVSSLVELQSNERTTEAIARVICLIADSRRPKLIVDHICWVTGMRATQGMSLPELARKHRISKQAFSQAALRLARKLGIGPSRQMRSIKARASMAKAYRERAGHANDKTK